MHQNPCYILPQDPLIKMLKVMSSSGMPGNLASAFLAECKLSIPIDVLRYTFGPLVYHCPGGIMQGSSDWLSREMIREWQPRVAVERLEILCGERADLVSPAELWLVMYNASMNYPLQHHVSEVYLWAGHRALLAAGKSVPDDWSRSMRFAEDAAVFGDGDLHHQYREICREIRAKVINGAASIKPRRHVSDRA